MNKELIIQFIPISLTLVAISFMLHFLSCLCWRGDLACAVQCQKRFMVTNIIGLVGIVSFVLLLILLHIAKKKEEKP